MSGEEKVTRLVENQSQRFVFTQEAQLSPACCEHGSKKQKKKKKENMQKNLQSWSVSRDVPEVRGRKHVHDALWVKKTKKRKSSPREPFYLQRGFLLPTTLCTLPRRHIGQFDSFTSHPLTFIHSHSVWVLPLKSFVSLQLLKNMSNPSGHRTDLLAALNCEVCCY